MKKLKVHFTKRYARIRVRQPKVFVKGSLRTQDIGRKGHSKRIAGKLKVNNKWATQAFLITRSDWEKKSPSVGKIMSKARRI